MKVFFKGLLYLCIGVSFITVHTKAEVQHPLEIGTGTCKIIDVSYHKGVFGERITFRFNGAPIFNHLPSVPGEDQGTIKEYHFFLPKTVLKGNATKQFVQQMNATTPFAYYVSLTEDGPMEGLLLTVKFDSSKVGFQIESGISPKGEPSITLTFHDRLALNAIGSRHSTVLNMAHLELGTQVKKKYA